MNDDKYGLYGTEYAAAIDHAVEQLPTIQQGMSLTDVNGYRYQVQRDMGAGFYYEPYGGRWQPRNPQPPKGRIPGEIPKFEYPLLGELAAVMLGADPEFFLRGKDGRVIESGKVLPKQGLLQDVGGGSAKGLVLDGVQVELNTSAYHCRERLCAELRSHFANLREYLKQQGQGVTANLQERVLELSEEEHKRLSDEAKKLGCKPSFNAYDKKASISVNPETYLKRSASGHIHLGLGRNTITGVESVLYQNRERLVPLLDILLGNTCVLIDRDPMNAERRQVYGRAGEYRLPLHGLEYRTLSNFWLRSYPLASFVLGTARIACHVLAHTLTTKSTMDNSAVTLGHVAIPQDQLKVWQGSAYEYKYYKSQAFDFESALLKLVDLDAVRRAINENNFDLAYRNWQQVATFLERHTWGPSHSHFSLHAGMIEPFEYFIREIDLHGLEFWFPTDPIEHWINEHIPGVGWERFIEDVVPAKQKEEALKASVTASAKRMAA